MSESSSPVPSIVVVGTEGAGTTLVWRCLTAHPELAGRLALEAPRATGGIPSHDAVVHVSLPTLRPMRWLGPDAVPEGTRVIVVRRAPLHTVYSAYRRFYREPRTAWQTYLRATALESLWVERHQALHVQYEELVHHTPEVLRRLYAHVGVDPSFVPAITLFDGNDERWSRDARFSSFIRSTLGLTREHVRGVFVEAGADRHRAELPGAVAVWRDRLLLIPGVPNPDAVRLLDALERLGAECVPHRELRFDSQGRLLPGTGDDDGDVALAAPVALVVQAIHVPGAQWQPQVFRGARACVPLLVDAGGTTPAASRLRVMARMAESAAALRGSWSDADDTAAAILSWVDAAIDGAQSVATPAFGRSSTSLSKTLELAGGTSLEREREALAERALVLLHWHGRFGNRMHQYAYGATYARLNDCGFWLPSDWEGTRIFRTPHHKVLPAGDLRASLTQSADSIQHRDGRLGLLRHVAPAAVRVEPARPPHFPRHPGIVGLDDMCAYHPGIFTQMSRAHLLEVFAFSDAVTRLDVYKRLEDRQGTYDIAHLRRDDISNPRFNQTKVQGYSVVSKASYEAAFEKFGFDPAAIEWVSDDYTGKWHTDRPRTRRGRFRYPEGSEVLPGVIFDWLEDFLRLYFARTIFRANSSFSWWAAFLSPTARVYSPVLDKRLIYGVDGLKEIDVAFVEGNHPHWMYGNADIRIGP